MRDPTLRKKVCELRTEGKTYSEIKKSLQINLPKSTLSDWCQGVSLPEWYKEKIVKLNGLNLTKAQRYAAAQIERKRDLFLEKVKLEAETTLKGFNQEGLKIALAMLYLGEGAKWKGHSGLGLGSSDPEIILLYIALLEKCYNIKLFQLKCRISYRADQNIHMLENFWSVITGIPKINFYKTKPDPRTIGKPTKKVGYKGVCVIYCAGSNIQLELEMLAKLLFKKIKGP